MSYSNTVLEDQYCGCFEANVPNCVQEWVIETTELNTNVVVNFKDGLGRIFSIQTTTDINGFLTIDLTDFPEELFNPFSGIWEVTYRWTTDGSNYRRNFVSTHGLFPCLHLTITDTKFVNYNVPNSQLVDNEYFICCCRKEYVRCNGQLVECCDGVCFSGIRTNRQVITIGPDYLEMEDTYEITRDPCCLDNLIFDIVFTPPIPSPMTITILSNNLLPYAGGLVQTFSIQYRIEDFIVPPIEVFPYLFANVSSVNCGNLTI